MMNRMIAVVLLATPVVAHADAFGFKDAKGFEKCMQLDHLVESVKTDKGFEHRALTPDEIQPRCVTAAAALVTQTKDKALGLACLQIARRESGPEMSIDVIGALTAVSPPACNEMQAYEVLLRPLSDGYETDWGKNKVKPIIKRCLRDKDFKSDFLEEKDSGDATRAANVCRILLEEKLVKSCKESK
jgi:hypothetical protein